MLTKHLPLFFLFALIVVIFKNWFSFGLISAGDFSLNQRLILEEFSLTPYSWSSVGLGSFTLPTSWLHFTIALPVILGNYLSLPWIITERVLLLYPLLGLIFLSPMFFFKKIFPSSKFFFLSGFIFASAKIRKADVRPTP